MSDQTWHESLSNSVHALHHSALYARSTYNRCLDDVQTAVDTAQDADQIYTALSPTGQPYSPYTTVTADAAQSYMGLAMSLGRVWYRAAVAYAHGVTTAVIAVESGEHPALAATSTRDQAIARLDLAGLERHRALADTAERQIMAEVAAFEACRWDRPARAWHDYADLVASSLRLRLRLLAAPTAALR